APVVFNSITPTVTPTPDLENVTTCGSPTVNGNVATCQVKINSSTPQTFTVDVTLVVTMGGVQVTRATNGNSGPGGSGSATKTFVAGRIIIVKHTIPAGAAQSFNFSVTGGPPQPTTLNQLFPLIDGGQHDSGFVVPASGYAAAETPVTNWDLISATCDNGSPVANISVAAGQTVTCTFVNRLRAHVTVI